VLQDCELDAFCRSEPFCNRCILVLDIFLNNALHGFDFVKPMVKPNDLADELCPLRDQAIMNLFINSIKFILETFVNGAYSMKLSIVRPHHCAVVADKLLATITEVSKRLFVHHAVLLSVQRTMAT